VLRSRSAQGAIAVGIEMTQLATKEFAYRFLHDIAQDLSRKELKFPTFIDASLGVRMALGKKDLSNVELARVVSSEPLLSARVVALANSVAMNPNGKSVSDVKNAVIRVGQNAVRSLAVSLAMEQIARAKELEPFKIQARELWEHSLEVAALAHVLAKQKGTVNPDEALFAGLVHDLGHFYLMWRATKFPELTEHPEELRSIVKDWHPGIGSALLQSLDLPEAISRACDEHELPPGLLPPGSLSELLSVANRCSKPRPEIDATIPFDETEAPHAGLDEATARGILEQASQEVSSLVAVLKG
jgi:HD-like signal output (HDOD) protein